MHKVLAALSVLSLLNACNHADVNMEAERKALLETDKEWSAVVASGNMGRVFDYWTEDAVIYPVGMPVVKGKAAIREFVSANRSRRRGRNESLRLLGLSRVPWM
jgi:ketosteroid isomerase-like protein